jgi:hypothetical protein
MTETKRFAALTRTPADKRRWTVLELYNLHKTAAIIKPRIQRRVRWKHKDELAYMHFIINHMNSVYPILINEKIANGTRKYVLFDGLNRLTCILSFLKNPLKYFPEFIEPSFPKAVITLLQSMSMEQLMDHKAMKFLRFVRDNDLQASWLDKMKEKPDFDITVVEEQFDEIIHKITALNIYNITIDVTIWCNITDAEICNIYESINSNGVLLTPQEILASSLSHVTFPVRLLYHAHDISTFVEMYYNEVMEGEALPLAEPVDTSVLNLHDVLIGFQIFIRLQHYYYMPVVGHDKKRDILFELYEILVCKFDVAEANIDVLNGFLKKVHDACAHIQASMDAWYNKTIQYTAFTKFNLDLTKNQIIRLITYACSSEEDDALIQKTMKRVILYHDLLDMLQSDDPVKQTARDVLGSASGGTAEYNIIQSIIRRKQFDHVPSDDTIRALLKHVNTVSIKSVEHGAKRKSGWTKYEALAMGAFLNIRVPSHHTKYKQNCDHIVVYSSKWNGKIDINRLGNMTLITSKANQCRGHKPITSQWIAEHDLHFQGYPSDEVYAAIIDSKKVIIDNAAYNAMCEKREQDYHDYILKMVA